MSAPIVSPAGTLAKRGKDVQAFTSDQDVTWTKSGGTFSGTAARAVSWSAPNAGGSYTVTATNGSAQSTTVTITVTGVCPVNPSRGFKVSNKKKVLLFEAEDGSRQTRVKQGRKRTIEFTCNVRQRAEFLELDAFWDWHYPGKQVYVTHPYTGVESLYWINSDLEEVWELTNLLGYSFVATEA